MQQNCDISTNIERNITITECISGNTLATMNPFSLLDYFRSLHSFTQRKLNI